MSVPLHRKAAVASADASSGRLGATTIARGRHRPTLDRVAGTERFGAAASSLARPSPPAKAERTRGGALGGGSWLIIGLSSGTRSASASCVGAMATVSRPASPMGVS
eukprot:scaffold6446_cov104-Isochrysis_galbana.AAC.5